LSSSQSSRRPSPGTVAVFEHSSTDVAGEIGRHLADRGFEIVPFQVHHDDAELPELGSFEVLMVTGSESSVNDDSVPGLARERDVVRAAVDAGTPVLGICFGAQLLAQALGGSVSRLDEPEVGWKLVETKDDDLVAPGPWLLWHEDHVAVPPGAHVLATSDICLAAFSAGPHLGVQFHPEVSPHLLSAWIEQQRTSEHANAEALQRLAAGIDQYGETSSKNAAGLVDRFLARAGLDVPA
jgi:GMP synthase (glutamine-hydrolysing)